MRPPATPVFASTSFEALESEDFDALAGEVYVRASLRTYAAYLGLKPEKVMRAYARHADDPEPPAAAREDGPAWSGPSPPRGCATTSGSS